MANEIKIILNAVDNASKTINNVSKSGGKLGDVFKQMTGVSLGAAGGIALVTSALDKGIDFTRKAVTETVDYNKTVREMTQVLGLSADETSRVIQVADDWGISIEEVRGALGMMNKNGVQPSIENLATLADEYVATKDKTAFAEKATKLFGRSYQTLIPILAKGGDALREQAESINENMIATDESIAKSREYEVAVDDLTDAWQGFKYELGDAVLPIITDAIDAINTMIDISNQNKAVQEDYNLLVEAGAIDQNAYKETMTSAGRAGLQAGNATVAQKEAIDRYNESVEWTILEQEEQNDQLADYWSKVTAAATGTEVATESIEDMAKASEEAAKVLQDELNQSLDDLNSLVNGKLGPEMEDFNETQADLTQRMSDTQDEIDDLIAQGYSPMSDKVKDLQGDYDDLKDQYDKNADEHDEATKRIMFDILTQQAAVDGLTSSEVGFLTNIATTWGLVDQETADATLRAQEAMDYVNKTGDFEGAQKIVEGQATSWGLAKQEALLARDAVGDYTQKLNALDGKVVNTEIITLFTETGERSHKRASGGPVRADEAYLVGERGPEIFIPDENGSIVPNQYIYHHTMNVYPNFINANGAGITSDLMFYAKQYGMA